MIVDEYRCQRVRVSPRVLHLKKCQVQFTFKAVDVVNMQIRVNREKCNQSKS